MSNDKTFSKLKLLASNDESGNIRTFVFETGGLEWIAGQSQNYVLRQAGDTEKSNQRRFTISSSPSEKVIHISTRVTASSFKQTLNSLAICDEIEASNLEGDFIWEEEPSDPIIMVAGGIGITPYRSILLSRQALGKRLNATLLYFNRTEEVAFRDELETLESAHPEFKVMTIFGQVLSGESILEHEPNAARQTVYLSGPEAVVESISSEFCQLNIKTKQDWFPGYDQHNY